MCNIFATTEAVLDQPEVNASALIAGLGSLRHAMPDHPTSQDLRDLFRICYRALRLCEEAELSDLSEETRKRIGWTVKERLEPLFYDVPGAHRWYRNNSVDRSRALQSNYPGEPTEKAPLPHCPLDFTEAQELAQPYLKAFERKMDAKPYAHLALCWKVMEYPIPPFDRVFDAWVRDIDRRGLGLGDTHRALQQAFALSSMARGRQHVSAKLFRENILPKLTDANMMVAAAAGRFVGRLFEDRNELFNGPPPMTLAEILDYIVELPVSRRAAAGGFLNGFGDDQEPFSVLREDPDFGDYDLDSWVLRVFADKKAEPYYPSSQAFWFYVHEYYWNAPGFVNHLIDADHLWEALMCATEAPSPESGMEPVLRRLGTSKEETIAKVARACLIRTFDRPDPPQNDTR